MGAAELLLRTRTAGFVLDVADGKLLVTPASKLTDDLRAELRDHKPELLVLLSVPATEPPPGQGSLVAGVATHAQDLALGNPLMNREQADRAHWPAWDGAEIDRTVARIHLFVRRGIGTDHAEHLAERLLLRDREGDDRRVCPECRYGRSTRCPDGSPMPAAVLHRCPRFSP